MSNYKILHGETGFDVMKDDAVWATGIGSRAEARQHIERDQQHHINLADGQAKVARVRRILREDYGLTDAEISRLLLHEAARGAQ